VAAKQTISSGAHASVEHAQQTREVERSACKPEARSMLREEGAGCDWMLLERSDDHETIERMRLPMGERNDRSLNNDVFLTYGVLLPVI
jgi:hypothetical protein